MNVNKKDNSGAGVIKKKVTPTEIEKWEVAQLNSNFEPRSKPSETYGKLTEKRKARHDAVIRQLAERLNEINLRTEKDIEISSMEVKAHMKEFDDELQNILKSIDIPEVASYNGSVFLKFQNKANEYRPKQQELVNELYDDLNKFEDERAKENKKLLHEACEEIRKIGCFLPYEVQSFVEHETLKMNQMSLNNRRWYDDLKLTLTLVTEQTFKSFMDKVFCIQAKWVQQKMQEAYINLQCQAENKIANLVPQAYNRLELKGQELIIQLSPDNLCCTCKAEEWAKNVEEVMAAIDTYGKNLIEIYKKTLNAVFRSFDHEVEEIKKEISCVEFLAIEERVIKPIMFEAQNDQAKDIENLELRWQETLCDIRSTLKLVTDFLKDAGKIWDRHAERICESKKLILKALEKGDENNQAILEDLEVKLNIALDALRQEHNKTKLQKAYDSVVNLLESIKSKYEFIYLSEVVVVEDFYKMMNLEADVLSAELKELIYSTHPMDQIRNVCQLADFRCLAGEPVLLREIKSFSQQVKAVKSWKMGVWSALETFSLKTREFLEPRAESWVQKKIEDLAEKKSIQIELTKKRFQRVRIEIYEKRLREIECHEEIFQHHKEGVKTAYAKMKDAIKNLTSAELRKLEEIKESFNEIEASAKLENRAGVIYGHKIMLEKKKEEIIMKLKSTYERCRADCEKKSFDLTQSNINYMKSIKLFHEDGNYSAEEGRTFATMLESVDKEISTELKNVLRDCTKEENDLIKKVSLLFDPTIALFSSLYEETLFYQEVQGRLNVLKSDIKGFADVLTSDFEALFNQALCLSGFVKKREEFTKNDDKFWIFLLRLLYRNVSNLLYPMELTESLSDTNVQDDESLQGEEGDEGPCCCARKFSIKGTISKTPSFRTTEVEETFNCKDLKKDLFHFEDPPEHEGTFMAVISNGLWTEMDSVQKLTCNFFKKLRGRKIIREDLIPPTYEAFMGEILKRFQWYNNQCEELWLQAVLHFLPVVGNVKTAANDYLKRTLDDFEGASVTFLKNLEEDFIKCLEFQRAESSEEFDTLDGKLLALHGHPQNKGLLDALEEEVVRRTASMGVKWESAINKFKNRLKCFRHNELGERQEVNKIHSRAFKIMEKIFIDDLGNRMLDLILEYADRGGFWARRTSHDLRAAKGNAENEIKHEWSEKIRQEFDLNLKLRTERLDEVFPYFKRLRSLIERERYPDTIPSECPPCPEESLENSSARTDVCSRFCEPKMNLLLDPFDSKGHVEEILERLNGICKRMKTFAESQENVQEEALFRWLSVWKFNVKKIQKLYTVRYEENPEHLEKPLAATGSEGRLISDNKEFVTINKTRHPTVRQQGVQLNHFTGFRFQSKVPI